VPAKAYLSEVWQNPNFTLRQLKQGNANSLKQLSHQNTQLAEDFESRFIESTINFQV